jgi:hypothetical protein
MSSCYLEILSGPKGTRLLQSHSNRYYLSRDSSVSGATGNGLGDLGSNPSMREIFPSPQRPHWF